jgi:hypothetical protein
MHRPAVLLLMCIAVSGCSLAKHMQAAKTQVAHFHSLLNAGNFDAIIAEAGPGMNWPPHGPSFKDYLASIHRKLGFCGSWRMLGYNEHWGPTGGVVHINADTHCDTDNVQESFDFDAATLRLRAYTVSSRALVVS